MPHKTYIHQGEPIWTISISSKKLMICPKSIVYKLPQKLKLAHKQYPSEVPPVGGCISVH
jgi:hypothetical protein